MILPNTNSLARRLDSLEPAQVKDGELDIAQALLAARAESLDPAGATTTPRERLSLLPGPAGRKAKADILVERIIAARKRSGMVNTTTHRRKSHE